LLAPTVNQSKSVNSNDISISHSSQLDSAIPASKIAQLSSGEFVGIVSDNPDQRIEQKMFHCQIINDVEAIKKEEAAFVDLPVTRDVTEEEIQANYHDIKMDMQLIIHTVLEKIRNDPGLAHLLIQRE